MIILRSKRQEASFFMVHKFLRKETAASFIHQEIPMKVKLQRMNEHWRGRGAQNGKASPSVSVFFLNSLLIFSKTLIEDLFSIFLPSITFTLVSSPIVPVVNTSSAL